ncbi:archaeosortase/exosortase family protein [Hymenobacter sp. J193]|uniref:exosortase X n=1 Tax=Hymenobacter sp. J193 TaxID=2898429 RepID=UPI0021506D66|nr:archaeosortase/exosortase family protein [Hymenobacter sp. J193]MCR5888481.1 archaeosortase/exosortase family protein [Hymenobacter sp. J193]
MDTRKRQLLRFGLLSLGIYFLWLGVYENWLGPDHRLDTELSNNIAAGSAFALRLVGFDAGTASQHIVTIAGQQVVAVWPPCNGLVLYALFTGFILAFPGPAKSKLWFIPIGIAAIYLINILRVAALALNHVYARGSVDFNHHYTFTFIVYAFILLLWALWVRRFAQPAA